MPIIKSAIKRDRQAQKRRSHNLAVKHAIKSDVKALTTAIETGEAKAIESAWRAAQSEIDRAIKKGTLHKNTAARRKSRLYALITSTAKAEKPKAATKATAKKPAAKKAATK